MISLLYPIVFLVGLVLSLVALVFGYKKTSIVLLILSVALDAYAQCVPLRLHCKNLPASSDDFTVLAFNVHGVSDLFDQVEEEVSALVLDQDADFVLLAEYYQKFCTDTLHNRIIRAGYECVIRNWESGNALYSRTGAKHNRLKLTPSSTGNVTSIEASAGGNEFNMYFCHLSSNNYDSSKKNYSTPDNIKSFDGLKFYLKRIGDASEVRRQEAEYILGRIEESDAPTIIIGDMNDVGGSPALRTLTKQGFKDAWWEGGFGYGATIHDPLPFRIDHIMYNDRLILKSIKKTDNVLLGTDCHNMNTRPVNLKAARDVIAKKLGEDKLDAIDDLAEQILGI